MWNDSSIKVVRPDVKQAVLLNFSYMGDDTGIGMTRFFVKGITTDTGDVETCDTVRIYGEDMFFIQMIVGGPYVAPVETSLVDSILSIFKKKNADENEDTAVSSEEDQLAGESQEQAEAEE